MTHKTSTNGYYELPNGLFLHFSMNTWYNLKQDTGKDITEYGQSLETGTDIEKAFALAEIVHAAAKAYNQEEGIDSPLNIYKVRSWFGDTIGAKEIEGITEALLWNTSAPGGEQSDEKKQKGAK